MLTKKFTEKPSSRDYGACGIAGLFNLDRRRVSGKPITDMITAMEERENGLGAGYAAYGLFPKMRDYYCLQVIADDEEAKKRLEEFLNTYMNVVKDEEVPIRKDVLREYPIVWRFFVEPEPERNRSSDDVIKDVVMHINSSMRGVFCMSAGRDMAVFKGVGWARDIARFYRIDEVRAYMWSAHSRFPTNTPGWWGGAHPFSLLGHAVVHNGEITSYGTNVSYLKELGYECRMFTDTEVLAYIFDYIVRKCSYPPQLVHRIAAAVLAPPYWRDIDAMPPGERRFFRNLRIIHGKAMANGPFSIIITTDTPKPAMIGHTDRKKLRPLVAGVSENRGVFYLSSEVNAIRRVDKSVDFWQPDPGRPVIATLGGSLVTGRGDVMEEVVFN